MATTKYQKCIGFNSEVFKALEQLKISHSINVSAFVNNATREAINKLKGVQSEQAQN